MPSATGTARFGGSPLDRALPVLEGALGGMVGFLALLGAVALFLRMVRSALGFALRAAEIASASGMAEASARRGDLTALSEARGALVAARTSRTRHGAMAVGWACWLVVPLASGWVPDAWALAAPLWILPGGSLRPPAGSERKAASGGVRTGRAGRE